MSVVLLVRAASRLASALRIAAQAQPIIASVAPIPMT